MLQKFYELLTKDLFLSECSKLGCFWKQRYSVFFILDALGVSTKDWYREKDNKHSFTTEFTRLLHMCFDRFLLAVESRDLSQADKSVIRVSSFSILQNFNFWTIKLTVTLKTTIRDLAIWCFGQFHHSKEKVNICLSFSGKR